MSNKQSGSHEDKGGRIFQGDGQSSADGKVKGHDLLNTDSHTDGVGTAVRSEADAKKMHGVLDESDDQVDDIEDASANESVTQSH